MIEEIDEIRWDVRPAPKLGTVEVRICDGVSTLTEMRALVALTHCLVVDLSDRLERGEKLPTMPPWHVQENKWRAARYGLDAWIILDEHSNERLMQDDLHELLEQLAPVAERLGCVDELALVEEIPRRGASYQRQRAVADAHRTATWSRWSTRWCGSSEPAAQASASGGIWSVAVSGSMPETASRSATSERACASTTSADRSAERSTWPVARPSAISWSRTAVAARPARELVGDRVGALREVVQQQRRTTRGIVLVAVARHRHPAYEHAGVAQREVQRLDQLGHRPHPAAVPSPERRGAHDREPLVGGRPELDDELVGRPRVVAACSATARRPRRRMLSDGRPQQRGDLPHDDRRLLARAPQRRPGHDRGGDQRHAAADQRIGPPDERRVRGRHQRAHDDGLHRCLVDEQHALVEQQRPWTWRG